MVPDPLTQAFRHIGLGAVSAIEDAGALGALFTNLPPTGDTASLVQNRLALFSKLRVPRVAVYKLYSDCPFFINAVQQQREQAERYMAPHELPRKCQPSPILLSKLKWYVR